MRKTTLLLIALLATVTFLTLGITGCSTKKSEEPTKKSTEEAQKKDSKSTEKTEKASSKTTSNSIADLFAKGKRTEGLSYELVMTSAGAKMTGKFWITGKKMRTDLIDQSGRQTTTIVDGEAGAFYSYQPSENMAIKFTDKKQMSIPGKTPLDELYETDLKSAVLLKDDAIDGMRCKVITVKSPDGKEISRMWVSVQYGIPVRTEFDGPDGKTVMEYKHIKVGPISADTFKLPAGVKVTDLNKEMQNFQNLAPNATQ